jgi:hypothetical protein
MGKPICGLCDHERDALDYKLTVTRVSDRKVTASIRIGEYCAEAFKTKAEDPASKESPCK